MNIYDDNGYLNFAKLSTINVPFVLIVGARGIGKTYGALRHEIESGEIFALMRRTQNQIDMVRRPEFSPFKPITEDTGIEVWLKPISKNNSAIYTGTEEAPDLRGYTLALSTIANLRGFSGQDIKTLIYDEFIPEPHERPMPGEPEAFLNAYETINRNRELQGRPPLKMYCLANSNNVDNAAFKALGLTEKAIQMLKRGQEFYLNRERGVCLIMPQQSPISARKAGTALYKVAVSRNFKDMALDNEFSNNDFSQVRSMSLAGFKPLAATSDFYVYAHKTNGTYYVTSVKNDAEYFDLATDPGRENYKLSFGWLYWEYVAKTLTFESYDLKSLFLKQYT